MSLKAILTVCWACLIAGAAIASENHRICVANTHTKLLQPHNDLRESQHEFELRLIKRVDVTN